MQAAREAKLITPEVGVFTYGPRLVSLPVEAMIRGGGAHCGFSAPTA